MSAKIIQLTAEMITIKSVLIWWVIPVIVMSWTRDDMQLMSETIIMLSYSSQMILPVLSATAALVFSSAVLFKFMTQLICFNIYI